MSKLTTIKSIHAREVLDSRGNPTVAVRVTLQGGATAEAMVPSGASTGAHEALEMRDNNPKRYGGKGVLKAVKNVNGVIAKKVKGMDVLHLRAVDQAMLDLDGTENKRKLGANAILGVSLAAAQAGAIAVGKPLYKHLRSMYRLKYKGFTLPHPTMNVINGGEHADNLIEMQEFMLVPQAKKFAERIRQGAEVFHALKKYLAANKEFTGVGDEGGFAPNFKKNEQALQAIAGAVKAAGYVFGKDIKVALDPASSEFYNAKTGKYTVDGKAITADKLLSIYKSWQKKYHVISIEDGFAEDDWTNWQTMTKQLGKSMHLVGDDLFVTNVRRLQSGIDQHVGNAILIKVNQIGSLSETIDTIRLAQSHGYAVAVSHRSGETEDTTIADLAVAVNAEFIKTGSLSRSERIAKYNRLLAIAEEVE